MPTKPILYGVPLSPPVRSVWLVAKEIGLELENITVDIRAGQHLTPDYLEMNPQHTVPTLNDNGNYIWDSHAISTYLISKYAKDDSLYPKDLVVRAQIDQRLHFDTGILFVKLRNCMSKLFFDKETEIPSNTLAEFDGAYQFLEDFLQKTPYLVGSKLTVADLACITTVTQMGIILPFDGNKYPKIKAWIERLSKLSYYNELNTKNLEIFKGFLANLIADNKAAAAKK